MGEQYETRDPWLIHLLLKKLDDSLRSQWAQHIVDNDYPTFNELLRFLKRKCDALETCAAFGTKSIDYMKRDIWKDERVSQIPKKEVRSLTVVQNVPCPMCTEDHTIYQCNNFKEASVQERRDLVQKAKLCFNCLRSNHFAKTCQSKSVCRNPDCKQRHHTLLCQMESNATSNQSEKSLMEIKTEDNNIQQMHSYSTSLKTNSPKYVVGTLPTAIVRIKGKDKYYEMRAMIDCGSQASLITESCVTRLGLHRANGNILITGVTNCASETTRGVVNLEISSRFNFNPIINTRAYVLNKLTRNLPQQKIDTTSLKCLESLPLADPGYDTPSKIDLILGVDVFLSILDEGKVKDDFGMPVAVNSLFGWLVAGQIGNSFTIQCSTAVMNLYTDIDVDRTLRQFWEIEEIVKPKHLTVEEKKAVEIFQSTHQRDDAGRFTVRLPMNDSSLTLGESLPAAIQRLKAMERRFSSDPNFKNLYSEFMTEYLRLGHMERVPTDEINIAPDKRYYLPHHAVLKEDSSTSKLRVVFDGSCRTSTGVSLNEKLLVGPNVNEELFVVLTRFRSYAVAFTADAEKMYRQVNVHKDDTDFQRIVWRFDPTQPIEHYRLLTVTYGTSCAAYLAMESLRQAAKDSQNESPIASERIRKNFYVDDLLSGANTLEEAIRLQNEIIKITSAAGFNLRKWSSNISQPKTIPEQSIPLKLSPETEYVKALGIHWSPLDDSFSYRLKLNIHNQNTKHRQLRESLKSESFDASVSQYLNNLGIKWTFITPNAPHMGGLWEAAVKSMKKHLRVVLGNEILTYEALSTILAQIEACLNSRPLCALSTSVDACEALTPGHFTIGQALNLIPEPSVLNITENRLDRYQRLCRYVEEFWDRWKGEFLATLQPRSKWRGVQANLKIGDLVIVKNDNTPPAYWELARVIAVHPDRNGIVRNVTLSKGQTEYQRPIHKLVVLPRN
ncbi:uncharacterized protein LOC131432958 [Malaya genurostris]|uniref:uncharacterized protein LOC131432958 n=1 Tax=Malaya genurostris TaxID=325434 RepID=UPI0026F3B6DD|nr:uncharacterized protein LOC131432958 [Malaya genurostris]